MSDYAQLLKLKDLAVRMHRARMEVERLRKERHALVCQHEEAITLASLLNLRDRSGERYFFDPNKDYDCKPCWKGEWVDGDYFTLGDDRGTCAACSAREKLRKPYAAARALLGSLRSQISRLAKKLAETAHA